MAWQEVLARRAVTAAWPEFTLLYDLSLRPVVPPEYAVPGLVGLTFRLRPRPQGGHVYVTAIDAAAALRLGARMGLTEGEAVALVDSHERVHVQLQLEGVAEEAEEAASLFVDAVVLSLRHPRMAAHLQAGDFGVVSRVGPGFWEALVDTAPREP